MVHLIADRIQFLETMKHLKEAIHKNKVNANKTYCELQVTPTKLTFAAPGSFITIPCIATGAVRVTFPFTMFFDLIKLEMQENIEMTFHPSETILGTFSFQAITKFYPKDQILNTIHLPKKCTLKDLLKLKSENHSQEELEFNKIPEKIAIAEAELEKSIQSCFKALKRYEIQHSEIEAFVKSKIYP